MKTIALLLCFAVPALADPPADAPVVDPDARGQAIILEEGSITPYRGVLLDEQEDVSRERARVSCTAELAQAKESAWLSKPVVVAVIVGALVLGAAAGAGVTAWALKK